MNVFYFILRNIKKSDRYKLSKQAHAQKSIDGSRRRIKVLEIKIKTVEVRIYILLESIIQVEKLKLTIVCTSSLQHDHNIMDI